MISNSCPRLRSLGPEAQFLLWCARARIHAPEHVPDLIKANFDWNCLFRTAYYGGLVPLLYRNVHSFFSETVPRPFLEQLRVQVARISAHNFILCRELLRVLQLFRTNGIEAMPYKGPALAERLYGDLALRHFVDLDLLVHKADVQKAKRLVLANGYRPKRELAHLTPRMERAFFNFQYSYDFDSENLGHQLEIHWEIVPRSHSLPLDYEGIWKRAMPSTFQELTVPTFAPEDLLLILCVGGAKHCWDRLSRICDVAETLLVYRGLHWEHVEEQAKIAGSERILFLALSLASTLLGAEVPERLRQRAEKDPATGRLTGEIVHRLFSIHHTASAMIQPEDQFQPLQVRMRERASDKIRYCILVIMTPGVGEWVVLPLPGPLYFLYYLLRPVRLAWKSLGRLMTYVFARARRSNS